MSSPMKGWMTSTAISANGFVANEAIVPAGQNGPVSRDEKASVARQTSQQNVLKSECFRCATR